MKHWNKVMGLAALGAACLGGSANAAPVALEDMLKEMKAALLKVEQSAAPGLPKLSSATLNATTVQKSNAGGSFKLFIVEFGAKRSEELTTAVSITLTPPRADAAASVSPDISDALAAVILSAAKAVQEAKAGSPPLIASEVKASIKFGVSKDGAGKIKLEFIPVIAPGIELGAAASTAQEIVVIYKN
ncbi:hypothetical protein ABOZ73_15740 [Caulobacter sp. 73W]|uniref:Uncharacterized protein n=1 Tax=Caulobacter sp. 73W TaxID=3161137 RepID=A0AB39KSB6_9CAUL